MRARNRLSATLVRAIDKPGRYCDGGGLWLQCTPGVNGVTKSWLFRFQLNGRKRAMGLGPFPDVSLAKARDKAQQAREQLADERDPLEAKLERRREARLALAKRMTFRQAAERYIASKEMEWKNEKHGWQWTQTLEKHAYPVLGDISVADIDEPLVLKVLEPIWPTIPETASRLRGRIEAVLGWATVHGHREGDNPARWRNHLDKALSSPVKVKRGVKHHAALPFADVPAFMIELREKSYISAQALEFTILTAARTGEVIGAVWDEIDLDAKVWTIPAARMKGAREHRIPLSARAVEILKAAPREKDNAHVFIGGKAGTGLSNMAMIKLLRSMREGMTVHGFRSAFRDWCGECTKFPREIAEAALAHALESKVEAAYRRGDALLKRRTLMDAWARYCATPPAEKGNVTSINRRAS